MYFSSDFKLKYWSGTFRLPLLLGHINYMIFLNIFTAYKRSAVHFHSWKYSQSVYLPMSKEKQPYLTKLNIHFFNKNNKIKDILLWQLFLLYNRQKRDTGNKTDTDQIYTETQISRKTFMVNNIRKVGNGHYTNYVAIFL